MEKKYLKIILISKLDWNMPWIVLHEMYGFFFCQLKIQDGCHCRIWFKHRTILENELIIFLRYQKFIESKQYINSHCIIIFICCVDVEIYPNWLISLLTIEIKDFPEKPKTCYNTNMHI